MSGAPAKKRARDFQRSKVYRAEQEVYNLLGKGKYLKDVEGVVKYLGKIINSSWFKDAFSSVEFYVEETGKTEVATTVRSKSLTWIELPKPGSGSWAYYEAVILHELAHCIQPYGSVGHGQDFCEILLFLVRNTLGEYYASSLKHRFNMSGVVYSSPNIEVEEGVRCAL